MKKYNILLWVLIIITCHTTVLAENTSVFQTFTPLITYVTVRGDLSYNDIRRLNATLYVSDDDIWFGGNTASKATWLLRMTREGEIYERWEIDDAPGNYPALRCISRVSDSLILGFIDSDTELATIGFQRTGNRGLQYRELGIRASSMTAANEGIFVTGHKTDSNAKHTWYALIGSDGQTIFEHEGSEVDSWSASYTPTEVGHLLKHVTKKEVNGESIVHLQMLDHSGNELWKKSYSPDIWPMGISSHEGQIYISGIQYGNYGEQKGLVMCTNLEGEEKWRKVFDFPKRLGDYSLSEDGVCMTTITENWIMYVCTLTSSGEIRKMDKMDLRGGLNVRGIQNTQNGTYIVMGTTGDNLFMYDISY